MHVVAVKAIASGTIRTIVTKTRKTIVIDGDDGTRYWYADIGVTLVEDGVRVEAGQVIARTGLNAPSIPTTVDPSALDEADDPTKMLPAHVDSDLEPEKPAQVVFVEPPPIAPIELKTPIPQPPKRYAKLVKIADLQAPPELAKPASPLRLIAIIGGVAAVIFALIALAPKPPTRRRPKRVKRKKKR